MLIKIVASKDGMEVSCTPGEENEKEESGDKEWPDE